MEKLKVGIIGCGNIFTRHAYSVRECPEAVLCAVCDEKPERSREWAEKLEVRAYTDWRDMIDHGDLDVIHICTPHYLHPEMAIYALRAGKHVLTEKPMAIKLSDAQRMNEAARESGKTLGVIFQNRYNPGSVLIKKTLESGALGKVLSARLEVAWCRPDSYYTKSDWKGTWAKEGGGVVIDQSIHTMDLLRWFIDSDIEYVDANIANRAHEIVEVEDAAEGVIRYKSGVLTGFYAINYYTNDDPVTIHMHCENGKVEMSAARARIVFDDRRELIADNDPREVFPFRGGKSYWGVSHLKQVKNFYESLAAGKTPDITGEEAIKTQEMISAIYESGKTHTRIYF